jgi:hypothetical protein
MEEEKGILKGDIVGKVEFTNQYGYPENGKPGTTITISNSEFTKSASSDNKGHYKITDVPFGIYNFQLSLEGYIHIGPKSLTHIGGKSPTMQNLNMIQIPDFNIHIDSAFVAKQKIYFFGKLSNTSQNPISSFTFKCFISDHPEVSKDSYIETIEAFSSSIKGNNITIESLTILNGLNTLKNDTVYFIIYPLAPVYSADLGKPSNILKYVMKR